MKARTVGIISCVTVVMSAFYVSSYYILSRNGFRYAEQVNIPTFFYFTPENDNDVRLNNALVRVYWPLNQIDNWLGTGRRPATSGFSK